MNNLAIIFSPIMIEFDTFFCKELINFLEKLNYRVIVYDSISLIEESKDCNQILDAWNNFLINQSAIPDVIIGQAFGGSLVASLLSRVFKNISKVILISTPIVATTRLFNKLQLLIDTFNNNFKEGCIMLESLVSTNEHIYKKEYNNCSEKQISKMILGYKLLQKIDVRDNIKNFQGEILSIYGADSQLVNTDNIFLSNKSKKQLAFVVSSSGMRPLKENTELALYIIKSFIERNVI